MIDLLDKLFGGQMPATVPDPSHPGHFQSTSQLLKSPPSNPGPPTVSLMPTRLSCAYLEHKNFYFASQTDEWRHYVLSHDGITPPGSGVLL